MSMTSVAGPPAPFDVAPPHQPTRADLTDGAAPLPHPAARFVGLLAVVASLSYVASDVIEVAQGGFSTLQLWLTLVAEAAIPVFVLGFAVVLGPRLGTLGRIAAAGYAYSYTIFTGTVVYALVQGTADYDALNDHLGRLMFAHGAVMVVAGTGLGAVVIRRRLLPRWAGACLIAGVIMVAATQGTWSWLELGAAAVRASAFMGFGVALVSGRAVESHH